MNINTDYLQFVSGRLPTNFMIAYMIALLVICAWKPEHVRAIRMFRWGCSLFVLSVIAPMLLETMLRLVGADPSVAFVFQRGPSYDPALSWMGILPGAVQVTFFSLSLFLTFAAIAPAKRVMEAPVKPPTKHPLD